MEQSEDKIKCPKCGSDQITAGTKGFSGAKAVGGALIAGPLGLLAGGIGSKKIKITCLKCGNQFRPGEHLKTGEVIKSPEETKMTPGGCVVILVVILILSYLIFS